jgi:hypothetical protein
MSSPTLLNQLATSGQVVAIQVSVQPLPMVGRSSPANTTARGSSSSQVNISGAKMALKVPPTTPPTDIHR